MKLIIEYNDAMDVIAKLAPTDYLLDDREVTKFINKAIEELQDMRKGFYA